MNKAILRDTDTNRKKLLAGLPVKEQHLKAAGIPTVYLKGGDGTPLVLLHGPGEPSIWWMRVIPKLVERFRVIVPDLPGHGSSGSPNEKPSKEIFLNWLDEFLLKTCDTPPVLIGHVVGGAVAAHYAIQYNNRIKQLILVDTLGLSAFRPAARFALEYLRFMIKPSKKSQQRFLKQCMFDVNELQSDMGQQWQPFIEYNLNTVKNPEKKSAAKGIINAMSEKIPDKDLKKIDVPVALIWGRHDKANKLKVAMDASKKFGWPLHVIENTRDDPKLERPDDFVKAVRASIAEPLQKKLG